MFREIKIGPNSDVRIDASESDVSTYIRSGDSLVVELKDGGGFVIPDFFKLSEDGFFRDLQFVDSSFNSGNMQTSALDSVLTPSGEALTVLATGVAGLGVAFGDESSSSSDNSADIGSSRVSTDDDDILGLVPLDIENPTGQNSDPVDLTETIEDGDTPNHQENRLSAPLWADSPAENSFFEDDVFSALVNDSRSYSDGSELDGQLGRSENDNDSAADPSNQGNPERFFSQLIEDDLLGIVEVGHQLSDEDGLDTALFAPFLNDFL